MIDFFRKKRATQLSEEKTINYVKYALGEILLIVIGILIALGVSNWNQERQESRLGKDYLLRIHHDLVQDTTNFRHIISSNKLLREDIKTFLVSLYKGVDQIEQVQDMSAVYDKALDQYFSPNDNTYRDMISSGTLGLIRNPELKAAIVDLYSEYDQKNALLSSIVNWMVGIATTLDTQTDFIKFNRDVIDIYTTSEMLNEKDFSFLNHKDDPRFKMLVRAISGTAFVQKTSNSYYLELITRCDAVLQLIDRELK